MAKLPKIRSYYWRNSYFECLVQVFKYPKYFEKIISLLLALSISYLGGYLYLDICIIQSCIVSLNCLKYDFPPIHVNMIICIGMTTWLIVISLCSINLTGRLVESTVCYVSRGFKNNCLCLKTLLYFSLLLFRYFG